MKRKREAWDFGESNDLYNTSQQDLEDNIHHQRQLVKLVAVPANSTISVPDLVQRRRSTYSLARDKRVAGSSIKRDIELLVPDFLRESVWARHKYSLKDVHSALQACPKEYIWQLALFYNVQILNSASRPSSCFIIRGGKSSAIDRTMKEFEKEHGASWRHRPNVLLRTKSCHKDPMYLPFHFISRAHMDLLVSLLPEEQPKAGKWLGNAVRHYQGHVKWTGDDKEDIHLVPLGVYWRVLPQYDFILLNRVLPYEAYCARYGQNTAATPLSEWSDIVYIASQRFALLEEAFYVVASRP